MIEFRPAEHSDSPLILEWRNDPETRRQSYNTEIIDPAVHDAWFQKKLGDLSCLFYICLEDGEPAGQFRIDLTGQVGEISYTVAPSHRGHGIGSAMIEFAVRCAAATGGGRIKALTGIVKKENTASCRCFEKNGFICLSSATDNFYIFLL